MGTVNTFPLTTTLATSTTIANSSTVPGASITEALDSLASNTGQSGGYIRFVTRGDSIMKYNDDTSWVRRMMLNEPLFSATTLVDKSVNGSSLGPASNGSSALALYNTEVHPYAPTAGESGVYLFIGVMGNDLAGGRTAADIYADLLSYIALARADGFKIIVCVPMDRTTYTGGISTEYTSLKASLRNDKTKYDRLIDFPKVSKLTDPSNTTYFADGTHPTAVGYALMANEGQRELTVLRLGDDTNGAAAATRGLIDVSIGGRNISGDAIGPAVFASDGTWATGIGQIAVQSNSSMAVDVGGLIVGGGRFVTSSTIAANFGGIAFLKENGTSGNFAGYTAIYGRQNAGPLVEGLRVSSAGVTTVSNISITQGSGTLSTLSTVDSTFAIVNSSDSTKIAKFSSAGVSASTTRTFTLPDANTTIVGTDVAQTLSNKKLTSPTSGTNGGTGGSYKMFGATSGDVTIAVPAAAGTATNFTLPNTNGTSGQALTTDGSGNTSWASLRQVITGNASGSNGSFSLATGGTGYIGPSGGGTNSVAQQALFAVPGTAKNLYVRSHQAPGGSETFTFTLQKNGSDTTITCTISAAGLTASDTTHTVTYAAGDRWQLKAVSSAAAAATTYIFWSFEYDNP